LSDSQSKARPPAQDGDVQQKATTAPEAMPDQRAIIGNLGSFLRLLREHQIFSQLSDQSLKDLVVRSDLLEFGPDELLLRQGDPSDTALLITQGEVDVFVDGSPAPVSITQLSSGALIGEVGVFAGVPRTAHVRAKGAVSALRMARDDLLHIGGDNPAFLRSVMKLLGERILAFNQAVGFYTNALAALDKRELDPHTLDEPTQTIPELVNFAHAFRRIAERIVLRRARRD
jgi:CRP-like cAMP-binding protein